MARSVTAKSKLTVAIFAHAHPAFSKGGAEIAAQVLADHLQARAEIGQVVLVGARPEPDLRGFARYAPNNLIWHTPPVNHLDFSSAEIAILRRDLEVFIKHYQPNIIHLHHFVSFGVEIISLIKQIDPAIKVVLTVHEMLAICHHNGQMVKTGSLELCSRASTVDCHRCFPEIPKESFWLRACYIKEHLNRADVIISPSQFLLDRLASFGLDSAKLRMIENPQPVRTPLPREPLDGRRLRLGYFGQINRYKGIDVLLKAMKMLTEEQRSRVCLEVHGTNLDLQPADFQEQILELRSDLGEDGSVMWCGAYRHEDIASRMAGVDWVLVPSVWWENSPMVIQEALDYGRPVACSAIGGMKEKVTDGVNGIHVPVGSPHSWAQAIVKMVSGGQTQIEREPLASLNSVVAEYVG
ncbi:glycosyltransferase [Sandarakinorhabdus sp.]|uniref:glycosyltransferase n=1 Tax=Sandarakinorhabdus sp. TaxID=1916663 RepID=UPI00334046E5